MREFDDQVLYSKSKQPENSTPWTQDRSDLTVGSTEQEQFTDSFKIKF